MNNKNKSEAAHELSAERQTKHKLYPSKEGFKPAAKIKVGGVVTADGPVEYNTGRKTISIKVRNRGDRPIQVGSHFHFFEVNRYLEFNREEAFGYHLNIPSTTAIRFEPGDEKQVELVAYAGKCRIIGFNDLTRGYAGGEDAPIYLPTRKKAFERMHSRGFKCSHNSTDAQNKE